MADLKGRTINIPMASVIKDIEVNVEFTGLRRWHLRLQLGLALMRLAIWVSGMGFKVEDSESPPLPDPNRPSDKALRRMFPPEFIDKVEGGSRSDAANNERYGNDEHLTDLGKEFIGTLREMRAKGYPRSKISQFLDHELGRCHAAH